jgi:hypothetical protein
MGIRTRLAGAALAVAMSALAGSPAYAADTAPPAPTAPVAAVADSDEGGLTNETVTANETAAGEQTCTDPVLGSHLAGFGDVRDYFLAPGGDFEAGSTAGWQFTGGAGLAAGNEPFNVLGSGSGSLALPAGSSATSPVFCVDINYPTFRFVANQAQAAADAGLQVDVIYPELAKGNVHQAAAYKPFKTWALTKDIKLEPQRAGKRAGWRKVALRFTVPATKKGADWRIDNILIDPKCRY